MKKEASRIKDLNDIKEFEAKYEFIHALEKYIDSNCEKVI
jgi:hypothetical protein